MALLVAAVLGASLAGDAAAQTVTLSLFPATLGETASATDVTVTATLSAARTATTTVTLSLGGTADGTADYSVRGGASLDHHPG